MAIKNALIVGTLIAGSLGAGIGIGKAPMVRADEGEMGGHQFQQAQQMGEFVKKLFELCHSQEATIIISELALVDLAKHGDVNAAEQLEGMLESIQRLPEQSEHRDALVRFTRLLLFNVYKETRNEEAAVAILRQTVDEAVGP